MAMPDGNALLFDLVDVLPAEGACRAPFGRRHSRPPLRAVRAARPSLAMLVQIRNELAGLAGDQVPRFRHLNRLVAIERPRAPLSDDDPCRDHGPRRGLGLHREIDRLCLG